MTSGGPTQTNRSVTRACGRPPVSTVTQHGGKIGPPDMRDHAGHHRADMHITYACGRLTHHRPQSSTRFQTFRSGRIRLQQPDGPLHAVAQMLVADIGRHSGCGHQNGSGDRFRGRIRWSGGNIVLAANHSPARPGRGQSHPSPWRRLVAFHSNVERLQAATLLRFGDPDFRRPQIGFIDRRRPADDVAQRLTRPPDRLAPRQQIGAESDRAAQVTCGDQRIQKLQRRSLGRLGGNLVRRRVERVRTGRVR